jgi:4,5-DOPA dioxygenase extradiol
MDPTSLFVSHGAPTLALDPGESGAALAALGARLAAPRAILMISAHWGTMQPTVGGNAQPHTMHDFGGFPRELYSMAYPAPGAPALAYRTVELLGAAGIPAAIDRQRGLDHGAWVPLHLMVPDAQIPVVQLSLQPQRGPAHHYRLGAALRPLRADGVLIVGSGGLTHNLHEFGLAPRQAPAFPWVAQFQEWIAERIAAGDLDALLDYRRRAPHAARVHPTDEHLLPLFVALGAAGAPWRGDRIPAGVDYGMLAMDAYAFAG